MMESATHIVSAIVPLLIVLIGLALAVIVDPYISRRHRKVMLVIVALTVYLVLRDSLGYLMEEQIVNPTLRTWNAIIGYSVRPVILLLFLYIVGYEHSMWPLWTLVILNALIHLTAVFSWRICFGFPGNVFHRGPLGYTSHIVSAILLLILLTRTIREYSHVKRSQTWLLVGNAMLVVTATVLDSFILTQMRKPASFVTISMVCSTLFYYLWLHWQFVWEHEEALRADQRIQIMMQQIQPHFLYNTLSTIQALCDTDPEQASRITGKFSRYLRQNIDSLSQSARISFDKEMEHTRVYADIEMIRFPNIRLKEDIQDQAFTLPALTVQPLVENAIRHGVRIRENGLVQIMTRRTESGHVITIRDNGKGFDMEKIKDTDGTHIGIENVRERIEKLCGGTLRIESQLEEGTTVTIFIPAEERSSRS